MKPSNPFRHLGHNATIYPLARIVYPENISLGDESVIDDYAILYGSGQGIKLGNFCHITFQCILMAGGLIEMGDFSAIAPGGIILASTDDYLGNGFVGLGVFGSKYRNYQEKDVKIGRHVHIGAGSIIMPGVTLGDGCSIGAGSLVTKDMPEWTICYGRPCKPIKDKPREKQLRMEKEFLTEYSERHQVIPFPVLPQDRQ